LSLHFPAAKIFVDAISTLLPVFHITGDTLLFDLLISLSVGLLAGLFPAFKAIGVPVQRALQRIG